VRTEGPGFLNFSEFTPGPSSTNLAASAGMVPYCGKVVQSALRPELTIRLDVRLFNCAFCQGLVFICSHCDCGHRYCSDTCCAKRRRERQRECGRAYQASKRGRRCHAKRQARYRERQHEKQKKDASVLEKVTQPSPPPDRECASLPSEPEEVSNQVEAVPAEPTTASIRCHFCGYSCQPLVRLDFLRRRRRESARRQH
jgi:hypothetical protein